MEHKLSNGQTIRTSSARKWWGRRIYLANGGCEFIGSIARSTIPSSGEVFYKPGFSEPGMGVSFGGPAFNTPRQAERWLVQMHDAHGRFKLTEAAPGLWSPRFSLLPN